MLAIKKSSSQHILRGSGWRKSLCAENVHFYLLLDLLEGHIEMNNKTIFFKYYGW